MSALTRNAFAMLLLLTAPWPASARGAGGVHCGLSVTPLAFGQYVPSSGAPSDFTATVTVTCEASGKMPGTVDGTIALLGAGGASGHQLTAGTHALRYQLYRDPARSVPWGDGSGDSARVAISGMAASNSEFRQTFTVYGRILARQSAATTGTYADAITVELTY